MLCDMQLTDLFIYPVKSLAGCAVDRADVDELGLVGDRRFMVIDDTGRFLTQRTLPRLALITPTLSADTLTLSHPKQGSIAVPRFADGPLPLVRASVWKSNDLATLDCGPAPAAWLSDFLGVRCRLVRIGPDFFRPILKPTARPGDIVSFADAFPFLLLSLASLDDLNSRLLEKGEEPLPMNRFRPNLVVSGASAFAEDSWPRLRIGEITFRAGGPCARCIVTTTDQATAEHGKEPLRTLATYRRDPIDPTDVNFGQNLLHETKSGTLTVGDSLTPLPER